jgi:hypothetical protein
MICEVYAETESFQDVTRRCGVSRNTAKKVWNELSEEDRQAYMAKAKQRNNDDFALDNTPKFAFEINRALHNMSFALRDICSPMNLKVMDVREFCTLMKTLYDISQNGFKDEAVVSKQLGVLDKLAKNVTDQINNIQINNYYDGTQGTNKD